MHQGNPLESYRVWRLLRGTESPESNYEFFLMRVSVEAEREDVRSNARSKKFPWLDFIT